MLSMAEVFADYQILCEITSRSKSANKEAKSNYYSRLGNSLNDPAITPKEYWSMLHSFLHKRKIPKIPPIHHNNTFLTGNQVKAYSLFSCENFFQKANTSILIIYTCNFPCTEISLCCFLPSNFLFLFFVEKNSIPISCLVGINIVAVGNKNHKG